MLKAKPKALRKGHENRQQGFMEYDGGNTFCEQACYEPIFGICRRDLMDTIVTGRITFLLYLRNNP